MPWKEVMQQGRSTEPSRRFADPSSCLLRPSISSYPLSEGAMNVSLTPELECQIEERLGTGLYTSASELVCEALRLFFRYDVARSREVEALDERIREGLAQFDRGEGIPGLGVRRRSRERLRR